MNSEKRKLIIVFACILLVLYVVVTCLWSNGRDNSELCAGLAGNAVEVIDEAGTGFVTSRELTAEIKPLLGELTQRRLSDIPLLELKNYLESLDKIESAEVVRLNNNKLRIRVVPMVPVARVWPASGIGSYYVNRAGKKIAATRRYHVDVPQLSGNFNDRFTPVNLMPLFDYLKNNKDIGELITFISAADSANIYLVPAIRGHVINLGDVSNIDNKFRRLTRFYSEVLPVKGWEHYDTISLKWDGQVVATRRHSKLPDLSVQIIDELEHEEVDPESVTTNLTGEQTKSNP